MFFPAYILKIIKDIESAGFEAFVVGGSVRDQLMGKAPKDWDITTNARPDQVLKIFSDGRYENDFGTVILPIKNEAGDNLTVVEITTFRSEQGYRDRRRPDEIRFEDHLDKDLERRDFTINALALKINPENNHDLEQIHQLFPADFEIIDLFGGEKDIRLKIIRAVGEPFDRFKEDALRMMRAIRFSCQLNFEIEPKTERAIYKMAGALKFIALERVRDELIKILESSQAYDGIIRLHKTKLLQYILPELVQGVDVGQDRHHIYNVFEHSVQSLKHCPSADWRVRFAALIHDIAKPQTKKIINGTSTFYNHEHLGAKIAGRIVKRLKMSNEDSEKIILLVRNHMFYYNVGEVTESSVRRLIAKVGKQNLKDLIDLRIADRLGSGVPKAKPYKLRHLEYMFDKVQNDPVSVKMLKIDGSVVMNFLKIPPSPLVGAILDVLLAEVIENPWLNNPDYLIERAKKLQAADLEELRTMAKEAIQEKRSVDDYNLKKGHKVS